MHTRTIGNTDLQVSSIGMGCWAFGGGEYWGAQSQRDVNHVVHSALERGINFFDTAEVYNQGASEQALGVALQGKRCQAIVLSKVSPSFARRGILQAHCEESLRRLQIETIDVYMLHWPITPHALQHFSSDKNLLASPPTIEEAYEDLAKLKQAGKIRHIGVSNFGRSQMEEIIGFGGEIVLNEITYNIVSRGIEAEILPWCQAHNVSIVGTMAVMQGLLTGKYATPEEVPYNQAHSRHYRQERGMGTSRHNENGAEDEMFACVNALRTLSLDTGVSMAELAIAWTLHQPGVASSLVGCRNVQQLEENLKAAQLTLSDDVIQTINRVSQPVLDKLGPNADYYENTQNSRIF